MITLTATLEAAQSKARKAIWKVVFTRTGFTTYTYTHASANPILNIRGYASDAYQEADIFIVNHDAALNAIDLVGYTATISAGATTSAGDEYSGILVLTVQEQTFSSDPTGLICKVSCAGKGNLMAEDEAKYEFLGQASDSDTLKNRIDQICFPDSTILSTPLGHCLDISTSWDVEDWLVDDFQPDEDFVIKPGQTRLELLNWAVRLIGCDYRFETDGKLHFFMTYARAWQANYNYYVGEIVKPALPGDWVANTAYSLNDRVAPTTSNRQWYICTTAGTSHASTEPTWPIKADGTVTDGTAVWTCIDSDYFYTSKVIGVSAATEPVWTRTHYENVEDGTTVWEMYYEYRYVI